MEIDTAENANWLLDYGMEDISVVPGRALNPPPPTPPPQSVSCFSWAPQPLNSSSHLSVEIDCSFGESEGYKDNFSRKRSKLESCSPSDSKACRERIRRCRLNERFVELSSVLEPGRPPKTDKTTILSDAVRVVTQLRSETKKLNESIEELQEKVKELKAEKSDLRDEKQRLKEDKMKLEQQLKGTALPQSGFISHPSAVPAAAFGSQMQAPGNKLMPFIGYPSVAMWQFIPPSVRDTSQDHVLRPPVA